MPCEGCYNVETTPCGTTGCLETINSQCILYNGGDLFCGEELVAVIENGGTLNDIIINLNSRICELTPTGQDWSVFDYNCLRQDGTLSGTGLTNIGTAKEFAEATSLALCDLQVQIDTLGSVFNFGIVSQPTCFTTIPTEGATVGEWFTWVGDNVCTITDALSDSIDALTLRVEDLETPAITPGCTTLVSGTSTLSEILNDLISRSCTLKTRLDDFDNTAFTCIVGAADNQTLETTITNIQTKICSLDTDVTALLAGSNSISLTYNTCLTSAAGSTGSVAGTVLTHLNNIIAKAGKTYTFGSGLASTTVGCATTITVDPAYIFTCSMLNNCDLDSHNDVVSYVDATLNAYTAPTLLFWDNGETQKDTTAGAWKAKELSFVSTNGSISVSVTPTANEVEIDLEYTSPISSFYIITPSSPNVTSSAVFAPSPAAFGVYVEADRAIVAYIFDITNVTWASTSWLTLGTVASGAYNTTHQRFLQATVINNTAGGGSFATVVKVDTGGTISIYNPTNASIVPVAPDTFSIVISGQSYNV